MPLTSNQSEIHEDLERIVNKHLTSNYKKPIAEHSLQTFDQLFNQLRDKKTSYIIDSGCGTGASCKWLSEEFPQHHIIGVDKSAHRLSKAHHNLENISYCRCDLIDFWRLISRTDWKIKEHYLLYPNPWPKKKHIKRRWHAHPIFPELLKLGGSITLRSDWNLYISEFELALKIVGINNVSKRHIIAQNAVSAFEQKYIAQERDLFELKAKLK